MVHKMEVSFNLFNIIIAFGMLQSFIFGIYLCVKSKFKGSQFYLGTTILFLSFYLLWVLKYDFGIQKYIPLLQFLPILFISGIGPSFYIYLRFLFKKPLSRSKIRLFFIPLLIEFIWYNSTTLIFWLNDWDYTLFNKFERVWFFYSVSAEHVFGLIILGIFLFKSYKLTLDAYALFAPNKIRSILICFIILWGIWCIYVLFDIIYYSLTFPPSGFYLFYLLFTALTYTIGFFGLRINDDTFSKISFIEKPKSEKDLVNDEIKKIFQEIKELMNTDKLYLNPDIDITSLAKQLDLHPNKVSAAINTISN